MEAQITEDDFIEFMATDFPSFKVTKCNLSCPTSDFVTSFYALMIEAMTSVDDNTDQIWNLTEEQCNHIKANPNEGSSFVSHIYLRNLHCTNKYIINQVNPHLPDFTYSDILLPENTPRRTFVFMSFMLHCFYYSIKFQDDLNDDMIACEERCRELQRKKDYKVKLLREVQEFEEQRADRIDTLRNKKSEMLKYIASNKDKENILKDLSTKESLINIDLKKLEDKEKEYQNELMRIENDISHFESLIVKNPNEVAKVHADKEVKKLECKERMKILQEQVHVSSGVLSEFNKITELLQVLNNNLLKTDDHGAEMGGDFKELQTNINNLNAKLSNLKTLESKYRTELSEKELILPKLKAACEQLESDQAAIICKGEERYRVYKDYIINQENNFAFKSNKIKADTKKITEIGEDISDFKLKCLDIEEKIKTLDSETRNQYILFSKEIDKALNSAHSALAAKLSVTEESN